MIDDERFMKKSQPPRLAQLVFALLTQPLTVAPSFSTGFSTVRGTSSSSAASEEVYRSAILALAVEPVGVEISGSAVPACMTSAKRRSGVSHTFLQTQATCGLCTAYFMTTSRIRLYSSEVDLKARFRRGIL